MFGAVNSSSVVRAKPAGTLSIVGKSEKKSPVGSWVGVGSGVTVGKAVGVRVGSAVAVATEIAVDSIRRDDVLVASS